ncbi:MAG: RHS repeat-associated core domain-containing protein [Lachnospiraceae bacterium]
MRTLSCTCPQSKCRVRNRQQHGGTTYTFDHDGYGNQTAVKAGDRTLERYSYAPNNGPLTKISYGNGDVQEILYDKEGRIKSRRWNGQSTDAVRYEYDDYGTLEKETDLVNGRIDKDQYDMTGRLIQSTTLEKNTGASGEPTVANTHTVQSLEIGYDSYNRVNRLVQSLEGSKTKTGLVYGDASKTQRPGLSYGLTVDGTQRQSLAYDAMARCTKETVTLPGGQKRENCFTYGTLRHLTDTDSLPEGAVSTVQTQDLFTYHTDGWKDQLLSWNGKSYAYDAGGNPTVLRGMALTWGEGRRLKRIAATAGEVTFAYDSDGKRVKKTSGNTETKYYYNGSTLSGLVRTTTGNTGTTKTTVQFVYDAEGKPFLLRLNGKTDYFYLYNGLGDVVGLVDSSNKVVVRYQYNSWGKVTSSEDTSGVSLATLNPFCYRKYVYDPETGLYCLGSRYYDPEVGRFVNADDTDVIFAKPQELYHKNLYVYCYNNPVVRRDIQGYFWETLFDIVSLGTSVVEVCVNPGDPWNWAGLIGDAIDLIPFVTGAGEATRAVKTANKVADKTTAVIKIQKAVDFTPESAKIVKSLDRSKGYTRSSLRAGTYINNGYKATTAFIEEEKEVRLLSKLRPDYVDKTRKIIYELKPMNKRNVKKGIKQLMRYWEEL